MLMMVNIGVLTGCPSREPEPVAPVEPTEFVPDDDAIAANNRAVGLMGKYEYEQAWNIFSRIVEQHPQWIDARLNLAIATLNRQKDDYVGDALSILEEVLEIDAGNLRAHYCVGLLQLYDGRAEEAIEHFKLVAERDPTDGHAAYYVGQSYDQQREYERALTWYERALERNDYLLSAYYGKSMAYRRLGRHDEADDLIEQFQRMDGNPRTQRIEFVYTRMGPKANAKAVGRPDPDAVPPLPSGAVFADAISLLDDSAAYVWNTDWNDRRVSITLCDITDNGALDIFIADALRHDGGYNAVLINDGTNRFTLDLTHPLARIDRVNAIVWGDIDNSGLNDAYLLRDGPNQLWKQVEQGQWQDITDASGTANGAYNSVDGLMFDADHDGDLDIFIVNADGPNELLNNNLDGTFRPIAQEQGIAGAGIPSRQIIAADLENDRDLDLIVINDKGRLDEGTTGRSGVEARHEVYLNDRMWRYTPGGERFAALMEQSIAAAVAVDLEADGWADLVILNDDGLVQRWSADEDSVWRSTRVFSVEPSERAQLAANDVTGDGSHEIIVSTTNGWAAHALNENGATVVHEESIDDLIGWTVAALHTSEGPSIIGWRAGEEPGPIAWWPGKARHGFTTLTFSGKHDPGESMRSNASGIGTHFAARIGNRWTAGMKMRKHAGPGQSLQPVSIGLGGADRIDFVAIDWSDGVFQSEIDLQAGARHHITETERQLASCPILFVWDGEKFEFASDIIGVGGLGFKVAPGEYAPARPWEHYLFPRNLLKPKDGRYIVKLGEPMEEVAFVDTARLVIYDVPPGWAMTIDERFNAHGPEPTGEPRFYRESMLPVRAVNDRGEDVTDIVREQNFQAAPVGQRDRRFIGLLMQDNVITLTFEKSPDSFAGDPMLIADGWVEYPYSQTAFASWQAGADYRPPTIEARQEGGEWQVVLEQFGYPAGMPREMSVPLDGLPPGTTQLRLSTNQEIYWDRIRIAFAEACSEAVRRDLPLEKAVLKQTGFAQRTLHTQRRPHYDYDNRHPLWDARHHAGFYTDFGPVEELISEANDALAIFGPGEEIHMEFKAPREGPDSNWTRYHVFEVEGWCKDRDLYSKDSDTLEPLPSRGGEPAIRDALHQRYNVRYRSAN